MCERATLGGKAIQRFRLPDAPPGRLTSKRIHDRVLPLASLIGGHGECDARPSTRLCGCDDRARGD
jgi:hypothetical protein